MNQLANGEGRASRCPGIDVVIHIEPASPPYFKVIQIAFVSLTSVGLARFDGHPTSGVRRRKDVRPWRPWRGRSPGRAVRSRRSLKDEIVGPCQRGDRSVGQVARDFDLTETAVREWVKLAERDRGSRQDGGLTTEERH